MFVPTGFGCFLASQSDSWLRFRIWLVDFSLESRAFVPPRSQILTSYYLKNK
nr:MAG TPA: hypothetical protein [Caudoviricetes sp.]